MKKKLLIINHDPIDLGLIEILKKDFELDVVSKSLQVLDVGAIDSFLALIESKHLSQYDCIFMDPAIKAEPYYSDGFSVNGTQTGYLLYQDYQMEDLESPIVVWSNDLLDMYEELKWGKNVVFKKKLLDAGRILSIVDCLGFICLKGSLVHFESGFFGLLL